jgi:GT2 family glycosyltransferase
VRPVLEKAVAQDPRIRVDFRLENGHISKASNSALELASGTFVALFDHDDELRPDALAEVALFLAQRPDCGLVYTDEDKIDTEGVRSDPYCKPDFLPDLIVGQNFCSHLSVFNTALVRELGGFREGLEGSQDWDLVLRVVERCGPERVGHVPKILYSWRRIAGSTAVSVGEKSYSVKAARRALQEHFDRLGIKAGLNMVQGCHWQVLYPLPEPRPLVSIIIPTHNNAGLLRTCVASLFSRTDYHPIELLIVNHQSDEKDSLDLLDELREEPNVRVFDFTDEFNYSAINNFAARHAQGEFLCLLNNDIEVLSPDWLSELLSHAQRPGVGAVGPMLYYPNRTIQHAGVLLGPGGVAAHAFCGLPASGEGYMNRVRLTQNYSAVTGACLLVRRSLFEQVGGLNEKELAVAFNDIDFCLKLRKAGCRNVWTPFAQLIHHESATRGLEDTPEKQERFKGEVEYMLRCWGEEIQNDPAYNPNLSLNTETWTLAWPPRV